MFTKSLYVQVLDSRSHLKASLHKQITEDSQVFRLVVNNEDVASGSLRRIHGLDATTVRLIIEWIQQVRQSVFLPARTAQLEKASREIYRRGPARFTPPFRLPTLAPAAPTFPAAPG